MNMALRVKEGKWDIGCRSELVQQREFEGF